MDIHGFTNEYVFDDFLTKLLLLLTLKQSFEFIYKLYTNIPESPAILYNSSASRIFHFAETVHSH
jgi:hypothetical protein